MARLPVARTPRTPARRRVRRRLDLSLTNPMDVAGIYATLDTAAKAIQRQYRSYKARKSAPPPAKKPGKVFRGAVPKSRVGRASGTFGKKGSKPKPLSGVTFRSNYAHSTEQNNVAYYGLPIARKTDTIYAYCMYLVQLIAKVDRNILSAWQAKVIHTGFGSGRLKELHWYFVKRNPDGTEQNATEILAPSTTLPAPNPNETYGAFAGRLRDVLITRAENGWFPRRFRLFNAEGDAYYDHNRQDEDMISVSFTMLLKVQNTTPAQDGNDNINAIDANPLMGKIYDFAHAAPRLSEAYTAEMNDYTEFANIGTIAKMTNDQYGIETKSLRAGDVITGGLARAFKMPPHGAAVFADCIGSKDVKMPPGGFYTVKRTHSVKCNLKRFLRGTIDVSDPTPASSGVELIRPPRVLTSCMFGLRPMLRTVVNEQVKLAMNMENVIKLHVRRTRSPNAPVYNRTYES